MFLIWVIVGSSVSAIFSLITFLALTVTKEMKNLHGFVSRCYLASYTGCMFFLTMFALANTIEGMSSFKVRTSTGYGGIYFFSATMFWLNVMSIDIWMKFRNLRHSRNGDMIGRCSKFVWYSIYAWGCSLVHVVIIIIVQVSGYHFVWIVLSIPTIFITICNICMFIATALMIRQHKMETARIVDRSDMGYQDNVQWFMCYVKLFVMIMTMLIIVVVAIEVTLTGNPEGIVFVCSMGPVHSILTMVMFIKKDEVGRACRTFFRCDSPMIVQTEDDRL